MIARHSSICPSNVPVGCRDDDASQTLELHCACIYCEMSISCRKYPGFTTNKYKKTKTGIIIIIFSSVVVVWIKTYTTIKMIRKQKRALQLIQKLQAMVVLRKHWNLHRHLFSNDWIIIWIYHDKVNSPICIFTAWCLSATLHY